MSTKRKKRQSGCFKYFGLFFCLSIVLLVIASIVSSKYLRDIMKGMEKPVAYRAYEELATLLETPPGSVTADQEVLPANSAMQELWNTDRATLEDRFAQFNALQLQQTELEKGQGYIEFWDPMMQRQKEFRDFTEEEWIAFRTYLADKNDYLEAVMAMAARGGPVCTLNLNDGLALNVGHLTQIRGMSRWLCFAAAVAAQEGNYDLAFEYTCAAFRCSDLVKDEPLLYSYVSRNASDYTALTSIWWNLPPGSLSKEQSDYLIRLARRKISKPRGVTAIRSDSYLIQPLFQEPQRYTAQDVHTLLFRGEQFNAPVADALAHLYRTPLSAPYRHMNFATMIEIEEEIYDLTLQPYYRVQEELDALHARIQALPASRNIVQEMMLDLIKLPAAQAQHEAHFDLLWMGLTLEQFYVETGHYPLFLENVIPNAPVDPFSGSPYRYESTGDSFLLYSIGRDLEDDGGLNGYAALDIVWRGANAQQ